MKDDKKRLEEYVAKELLETFIYTDEKAEISDRPDIKFNHFAYEHTIAGKIDDNKFSNTCRNISLGKVDIEKDLVNGLKIEKFTNGFSVLYSSNSTLDEQYSLLEEAIKAKRKAIKDYPYEFPCYLFITSAYACRDRVTLKKLAEHIKIYNSRSSESLEKICLLMENVLFAIGKDQIIEYSFSDSQYDELYEKARFKMQSADRTI